MWLSIAVNMILLFNHLTFSYIFSFLLKVFGKKKALWLFPLYSEDDFSSIPALHGLDFPTRSDVEAWEGSFPVLADHSFDYEGLEVLSNVYNLICFYSVSY